MYSIRVEYYNVKHRKGTGNVCTRKYGWLLPEAACLDLASLALLSFFRRLIERLELGVISLY
jgi:hypothetical protein